MTASEIRFFLNRHKLSHKHFARLIGVTPMAVEHWLEGRRSVSLTVVRLIKMFDAHPDRVREWQLEMLK